MLCQRDHVLPSNIIDTTDKIIIIHASQRASVRSLINAMKSVFRNADIPPPLFAIAVPNALVKPIHQLQSEITNDHREYLAQMLKASN